MWTPKDQIRKCEYLKSLLQHPLYNDERKDLIKEQLSIELGYIIELTHSNYIDNKDNVDYNDND